MRVSWRPKCLKMLLKKTWAIPVASMVLEQGVRITPFVSPWSTMTTTESWPSDGGRSVMRSTDNCLKGRVCKEGIGTRGGMVGWVLTLFCWQAAQPSTKFLMKEASPGHQKLHSRMVFVWKMPMWPEEGEE